MTPISGCVTGPPPEKPEISVIDCSSDATIFFCFDRDNFSRLVIYLMELQDWSENNYTLCKGDGNVLVDG